MGPRRLNFQRVVRETPRLLIPGPHFEPVGCHSCHAADRTIQSSDSEMLEGTAVWGCFKIPFEPSFSSLPVTGGEREQATLAISF